MLNLLFSIFEYSIASDFTFRLGTRESWIGPKTSFNDFTGYTQKISTKEELDKLLSKRRTRPEYILLSDTLLTSETMDAISKKFTPKEFLGGVMVYSTNDTLVGSTESKFPNKEYSYYKEDFEWNPAGSGKQYSQYDFPIIYPVTRVSEEILKATEEGGEAAGIYSKIRLTMRKSTKQCLKDNTCKILGGISVIGGFANGLKGEAVWAVCSIDAFGLVPYRQVGADYSISGFVATLAAIQSLKGLDWTKAKRPLRFGFFDGEEVGYLGSERFLYEASNFKCKQLDESGDRPRCKDPYRLYLDFQEMDIKNDIKAVVEIKNVGLHTDETKIYAHTQHTEAETQFVNSIKGKVTGPLTIEAADPTTPGVPPSTTNTFLKYIDGVKHVVFAGHKREFINKNIGTPKDDQYDPEYITKAATVAAKTLASLCFEEAITADQLNAIEANATFVKSVMEGFVGALNDSKVLQELFNSTNLPSDHTSLYTEVYAGHTYKAKQQTIILSLREVTATNVSDVACETDSDCNETFKEDYFCSVDKKCKQAYFRPHPAYSLAFERDPESRKYYIERDDPKYSMLTETNWQNTDIRVVTIPSLWVGRISIGIGIIIWLILSLGGASLWSYLIKPVK